MCRCRTYCSVHTFANAALMLARGIERQSVTRLAADAVARDALRPRPALPRPALPRPTATVYRASSCVQSLYTSIQLETLLMCNRLERTQKEASCTEVNTGCELDGARYRS